MRFHFVTNTGGVLTYDCNEKKFYKDTVLVSPQNKYGSRLPFVTAYCKALAKNKDF